MTTRSLRQRSIGAGHQSCRTNAPVAVCGPRHACRDAVHAQSPKEIIDPIGKGDVLVIDPPWPIKKMVLKLHGNEKPELDYKTMSVDDITRLNLVERYAAENCHVFLWTTNRFLPAAIDIFKTWEVKYSLPLIWHKSGGPQPLGLSELASGSANARHPTPLVRVKNPSNRITGNSRRAAWQREVARPRS